MPIRHNNSSTPDPQLSRPVFGLSGTHISPQVSTAFHTLVATGGRYARIRGPKQDIAPRITMEYSPDYVKGAEPHPDTGYYWGPKKRGKIRGFSRAARLRMLETMASINVARVRELPLFVTLTYPAEWPEEWRVVKAHMDAFRKRLLRAYPAGAAIWKLERQSRGAPHVHMLIYGLQYLPHAWLAGEWYAIVGSGDAKHLAAGTQVKRVRSHRQAMYYASKYLGKQGDTADNESWGRRWGIWNARHMPIDIVESAIPEHVAHKVRRWMWQYARSNGYRRRGRRGRHDGTMAWLSSVGFERLVALAEYAA
jgi:hypothetical protein